MIFPVLSGVLLSLSTPGLPFGMLVWFSLIPLIHFLRSSRPLKGALGGFLFFATAIGLSHLWVLDTITRNFPRFAGFTPFQGFLVYLLFVAFEASFYALFGFLGSLLSSANPYFLYPSLYVLVEILRGYGDLGFTGGRISDPLFSEPHLVVLSSIFGDLGLSFLVVLVNVFLWRVLIKRDFKVAVLVILLIYLPQHVLTPLAKFPPQEDWFEFYVYQTSEEAEDKYKASISERLDSLPRVDGLLITPEAYVVSYMDPSGAPKDVILGALVSEDGRRYNSAILNDQRYDKVKLFPFVEFLPYPKIFSFLKFLKGFAYFSKGGGYKPLDYEGRKIGVLICFESYFEEGAVEYSRSADLIVAMTNDVWFRYDTALWNHFAKSVFRAAESGRWVVQVANKGITGVVDGWGRIRTILPIGKEAVKKIGVGRPHPTLYPIIRKYLLWIPIALILISILQALRAPRSPYSRSYPSDHRSVWRI